MLNKEKKYYVYMYTSPSGKHYVGRSCNSQEIRGRSDGSGYKQCTAFWRAIQKYGWDNFEYEVLEQDIEYDKISERELYWINYYHSSTDENGYNLLIPDENDGFTYSQETLERISQSHIGQTPWNKGKTGVYSEEALRRMSESHIGKLAGENSPNYGKHLTEDVRKKISDSLKGKYIGEKHPMYGKQLSDEAKKKISKKLKGRFAGQKNPMYGKHCSEETKKKISDAMRGKYIGENNPMYGVHLIPSQETRKKISEASSVPVMQFDLDGNYIHTFKSRKEAAETVGINSGLISACCVGRKKSAGGYQWCNVEDASKIGRYESKKNLPTPVVQIEDGKIINIFDSITSAQMFFEKQSTMINRCLNGLAKSAYGYYWKYLKDVSKSELEEYYKGR